MSPKELFLKMKGWEKLNGSCCTNCDRRSKTGRIYINNYLNMKIAAHWVMCEKCAFKTQIMYDKGEWRQSSYYDGRSW